MAPEVPTQGIVTLSEVLRLLCRAILSAWRTARSAAQDDLAMVAGSIAFSSFLSLLPLLVLVVLAYGAFNEPDKVIADLRSLIRIIPPEARGSVDSWLGQALFPQAGRGAGIAVTTMVAMYSASRAGRSLLYGLNLACRVDGSRGFVGRRIMSMMIVIVGAALVTAALFAISFFALIASYLPDLPFASEIARILFWAGTAIASGLALTAIYRVGPARTPPPWLRVAPGAALATILWIAATGLFSLYLNSFGHFGRIYGSLGAIILLQLWLFGSAFVFLFGARFNVELESTKLPSQGREP